MKDAHTKLKLSVVSVREFICKECVESHKKVMKLFAAHEVRSLEDMNNERAGKAGMKERPSENCHVHEEPLDLSCFDCDTSICLDGTAVE